MSAVKCEIVGRWRFQKRGASQSTTRSRALSPELFGNGAELRRVDALHLGLALALYEKASLKPLPHNRKPW
eukprot:9135725-Alexandrium_andersonii.AAC.1